MRKRTWKTTLTSVLFAGMVGAVALGGVCMAQAAAEETTGFKMTGAEARVVEPYGLRFTAQIGQQDYAKIDKDGEYFGMLIIPDLYLNYFAEELEKGGNDYVTVLEQQNVFVANVHPITPYVDGDYYRMNGVLGEVAYDNLNEPFVGIAYMYNEGGYEYAEIIDETGAMMKTSFGDIVGVATASGMTGVAQEAKALAYQLNYLALAQKTGVEEDVAKATAETLFGQKWETSLASGLTGNQVANFDDERYLQLLSKTDTSVFNGWTSNFASGELNVVEIDGRTALELQAKNYRALKIQFVKPAVVTENTVVRIKMKNPSNINVQVQQGTIAGSYVSGWVTTAYLATDLGYEVGEVMSSVSLRLHNATEWYYIDEITVSERADLVSSLNVSSAGYGEVSNFNSADYATVLDGKNAYGAIVKDGNYTVETIWSTNYVTKTYIPFAREITVRDGDKLTFTMTGVNVRIDKKDGTQYAAKQSYTAKTLTILLTELGYEVGEKVSYLTLCGDGNVAYVGTISLISSDNEVNKAAYDEILAKNASTVYPNATSASVNFSDEKATALVQSNPYDGNKNYTTAYIVDEQAVKITSTSTAYQTKSVRLYFAKPITLTANTKVQLAVKVDMNINNTWTLKFGALGKAYQFTSLSKKTGEYVTVTLKTDDRDESWNLFNSSMHGKELSYLDLVFCEDFKSISIKSITVIE